MKTPSSEPSQALIYPFVAVVSLIGSCLFSLPARAADCVSPPAGLLGWWQGENSTKDTLCLNDGTVDGYGTFSYGTGVVGKAFVLDGIHRDRVNLGNPLPLQLQVFTIEAWIKRSHPVEISLDDNNQDGALAGEGGLILSYGRNGYGFGMRNNGQLILSKIDVDGVGSSSVIVDTNWHHVAVVKSGAGAVFYIDGVPASANIPYTSPFSFETSIAIGSRGDARGGSFWGSVDEVCIYDHPLNGAEIAAIYNAGASGKCHSPRIRTHPKHQLGYWGKSVTFEVSAYGQEPLSYQWLRGGTPIPDATAAILVLTNLQLADAGPYTVVVTNTLGSTTSDAALLTMNPAGVSVALHTGVTIEGVVGQTYGIQYSMDLGTNSWVGIANVLLNSATQAWFDPEPATSPKRFYRVVPGPISLP